MKITRSTVIAVLVASLLLAAFVIPAGAQTGPQVAVNVDALNVRGGPGTGYAIIAVLRSGASVPATGKDASGIWYQVTLADGRTGWLHSGYVQLSGDASGLAVVAAPAAAPVQSVSRGSGNTIVFQVSSGGPIYVMNANGANVRYLTHGIDPAISPDGSQVAFTRWSGNSTGVAGDLWVIGIDGSGERKVMGEISQPKSPIWTNDGKKLIVNIQRGFSVSPVRCIPDDFNLPPEADEITHVGDMVCFKVKSPLWRLRAVDVGSGAFEDVPGDVVSFAPAIDPANPWRVVYVGERGLVNVDITRGNVWQLNTDPADNAPVFSPDGSKIATSYWQTDHWEVHIQNADGTGRARLTQTPTTVLLDQQLKGQQPHSWNNAAPAWSPDGRQIAFLTDRSGQWEIWTMNADGSNQRRLLAPGVLGGQAIQYHGVNERVISWR